MPNSKTKSNGDVRVLVVEDDPNDRELLSHQLRRGGMDSHVKFIADGKEALCFLTDLKTRSQAKELIAIFLDIHLPSLGGVEILRRLRQDEDYAQIPIVIMSSAITPADLEECQRLKIAHYIPKPVTFASFSKAVADAFPGPEPGADLKPTFLKE
jgi:two-component system, response regulator